MQDLFVTYWFGEKAQNTLIEFSLFMSQDIKILEKLLEEVIQECWQLCDPAIRSMFIVHKQHQ